MDELIQLVTFLVVFGAWVLSAVSQAKKRRQKELEEVFEEFEEDTPSPINRRPEEPRPVATRPPKKTGWEEIQQELRRMLEENQPGYPTREIPPPVIPPPRQLTIPVPPKPKPVVLHRPPVRPSSKEPVRSTPPRSGRVVPSHPDPRGGVALSALLPSEPMKRPVRHVSHPVKGSKKETSEPDRRFPNFHPNPIANAIILSEILKCPKGLLNLPRGFRDRH